MRIQSSELFAEAASLSLLEYGVSKNKKVFEQMLEVCRRIEVLKSKGEQRSLTDHQ